MVAWSTPQLFLAAAQDISVAAPATKGVGKRDRESSSSPFASAKACWMKVRRYRQLSPARRATSRSFAAHGLVADRVAPERVRVGATERRLVGSQGGAGASLRELATKCRPEYRPYRRGRLQAEGDQVQARAASNRRAGPRRLLRSNRGQS